MLKKSFIALSLMSSLLVGCATPARVGSMQAAKLPSAEARTNAALKSGLAISPVTGGKETNPLWTSQVSSADFESALKTSMQNAGLLGSGQTPYTLKASLVKFQQPLAGLDMTVTATVNYDLLKTDTQKTVLSKTVSTPYTAKFGDAAVGTERLRLATEGAARSNIEQIISLLTNANIEDGQVRIAP